MPILGVSTITWCIVLFTMTLGWNFSLVWRTAVIVLGILPYGPVWHLFSLAAKRAQRLMTHPSSQACVPLWHTCLLPSILAPFLKSPILFLLFGLFNGCYLLILYIINCFIYLECSKYKFKPTNTKRGSVSEMILLYSNHVDSFTLPQTFMWLLRKWTGIVIQGI